MRPSTPFTFRAANGGTTEDGKTELQPSTRLRKRVFRGSLESITISAMQTLFRSTLAAALLLSLGCDRSKNKHGAISQPYDARLEGDIYTNSFFGFSLTVPDGWSVVGLEQLKTMQQKNRERMLESKDPRMRLAAGDELSTQLFMMSLAPVGTPAPQNVLFNVKAEKLPPHPSAHLYLTEGAKEVVGLNVGFSQRGKIIDRSVGNIAFSELTLTQSTPNGSLVQKQIAAVIKDHMLAFILTAPNDVEMISLEGALTSVRFQ